MTTIDQHNTNPSPIYVPNSSAGSASQHTQTIVATIATNSGHSTFDVNSSIKIIEKIRRDVATHYDRYHVQGRNAMLEIMSQVYEQFKYAKDSGEFEKFMGLVRIGLAKIGATYSHTSAGSSQLIKYLFAELSYKQTHVYSRALDEAYRQSIMPSDFKSFIEKNGGFEGVRQSVVATSASAGTNSKKLIEACTEIDNSPTLETIEVEWNSDEKYRVYVAVLNEDGCIDLKDSRLNKKYIDEIILRIKSYADQLKKTPKSVLSKITDDALLILKSELAVAKSNKDHLGDQLDAAIAENNQGLCEIIRTRIAKQELTIRCYELGIADHKKSLKASTN